MSARTTAAADTAEAILAAFGAYLAAFEARYAALARGRRDAEMAATFFNSVVRRVLGTVGVDRRSEFTADCEPWPEPAAPPLHREHPARGVFPELFERIFADTGMAGAFADLPGDAALCARAAREQLGAQADDARAAEIHVVFSVARSYFHADTARVRETVEFLRSLMPAKPVNELYNSLGHNRHGRTELYRELTRQLAEPDARFEPAEGVRGLVMTVFTLPAYNVVFKVIRDRFTVGFWREMQRRQAAGEIPDFFPYPGCRRLAYAAPATG